MNAPESTLHTPSFIAQGNSALRDKEYERAIRSYIQALQATPVLGNSISGNIELARQRYQRARQARTRDRVAVCGWELAHNAAGRVYTLAKLYETFADVEIIGSIFPMHGREVWEPIRNTGIPRHTFVVDDQSRFIEQAIELVAAHPYDIVHLSKPRAPNIFFGVLYKLIWGAKVLVDIDDEELAFVGAETPISIDDYVTKHGALPALKRLDDKDWTRIAVGLVNGFDGITVSNPALQLRYGGEIIRHARDQNRYQPSPELKRKSREKFGVGQDKKVVLFCGTPRRYKGLLETADAIASLGRQDVVFAIIGDFLEPALKNELIKKQGINYKFVGNQPYDSISEIVAIGDVTVLMQDPNSPVSQFQVPAKLTDALAMGLTVLATNTPALEEQIKQGIVLQINAKNLAKQIADQLDKKAFTQPCSTPEYKAFKDLYSLDGNKHFVKKLIDGLKEGNADHSELKLFWKHIHGLPLASWPHESLVVAKDSGKKCGSKLSNFAVVVHIFYLDLWPEIARKLLRIEAKYDLYITTPLEQETQVSREVLATFPDAKIHAIANKGMDILPFLQLVPVLIESKYCAVCKIHTKRGDGELATVWRDVMLDSLIGSNETVAQTVTAFEEDASLTVAGPSVLFQSARRLMYENEENLNLLYEEIYGSSLPSQDWGFFAGTMFWVRPEALSRFNNSLARLIPHFYGDYKRDGKIEHAIERFFGLLPIADNGTVGLLVQSEYSATSCSVHCVKPSEWIGSAHIGDVMRQYKRLEQDVSVIEDSGIFDSIYYKEQVPYLDGSSAHLIVHYLTHGTFNNIKPTRFFSPGDYRFVNKDVANAQIEPFVHYLTKGAVEKRRIWGDQKKEAELYPYARYVTMNATLIDWRALQRKQRVHDFVSIVIPVYNNIELTEACLLSLQKAKTEINYEVIIVDNGSKDALQKELNQNALRGISHKIIRNEENLNFALGCNIGFSHSSAEAVVFLNNDTTVTDWWLDHLVKGLKLQSVAATQPKLLYPDNTIQCAGIVFSESSPLGYPIYANAESTDERTNKARVYQAITAACMAVRSEHFATLKGFDPTFVNGQEDVDFCLRLAHELNFNCYYEPSSIVYHHESKTPGRGKYITLNRQNFVLRWCEKIKADDRYYYLLDQTTPIEWRLDSFEHMRRGIAIKRPDTIRTTINRRLITWDESIEQVCLRRLESVALRLDPQVGRYKASICMPAYNRGRILKEAVESVQRQSHSNFELIICDDGSDDDTFDVAKQVSLSDARIRVISAPHEGVSAARNRCLDSANGEIIFFLDTDNLWNPNFLRNMISFMVAGNLEAAYCAIKVVTDDPSKISFLGSEFNWLECLKENYIDLNCFCHRSGLTNRFDTSLKRLVDWDYILGITAYRKTAFLPHLGVVYYDGNDNSRITNTQSKGPHLGANLHRVREKWTDIDLLQASADKVRPTWGQILGTKTIELNFAQYRKNLRTHLLLNRGQDFFSRIEKLSIATKGIKVCIKIPAPSLTEAHEWGDYHFAIGISKSLEELGYYCRIDCMDSWYTAASKHDEVVIALRGLSRYNPDSSQLNLLWNISHPNKITDDEYNQYDHVFVASQLYGEILAQRLETSVSVLLQATDPSRFGPSHAKPVSSKEILFVGNSRNIYRNIIRDAISADLDLAVYGTRWEQFIPPKFVKGDYVPNEILGRYYGLAGVVLNDHWDTMQQYGFISNRLFDAVACGARVISDEVPGIKDIFGDFVLTYSDSTDLRDKTRTLLRENNADFCARLRFAETFVGKHNFSVRANTLIEKIREVSVEFLEAKRIAFCRPQPNQQLFQ